MQAVFFKKENLKKNLTPCLLPLFLSLTQQICNMVRGWVGLCGCQSSLIGLSRAGVKQETDPSRYEAFLAFVRWVIRGCIDSTVTVAHKLMG